MEECWYLGLNVVESMYFNTTLMFAKLCPPEYVQTQIYRRRVECIDIAVQFEDVNGAFTPSFINKKINKILKDAIVSILICSGKITLCHVITKSYVITFLLVSIGSYY